MSAVSKVVIPAFRAAWTQATAACSSICEAWADDDVYVALDVVGNLLSMIDEEEMKDEIIGFLSNASFSSHIGAAEYICYNFPVSSTIMAVRLYEMAERKLTDDQQARKLADSISHCLGDGEWAEKILKEMKD